MNIEVGKSYKTRDNEIITIVRESEGGYQRCNFLSEDGMSWNITGKYDPAQGETALDLVAEWIEPDADGWIEWKGGECPVELNDFVEIRWREQGLASVHATARDLSWKHTQDKSDIVAYRMYSKAAEVSFDLREHTGGSVSYYGIELADGTEVECNDIIKALKMSYAEGNVFKAVWRIAAARQGKSKRGYDDALYDAEKVVFFGNDMIEAAKESK